MSEFIEAVDGYGRAFAVPAISVTWVSTVTEAGRRDRAAQCVSVNDRGSTLGYLESAEAAARTIRDVGVPLVEGRTTVNQRVWFAAHQIALISEVAERGGTFARVQFLGMRGTGYDQISVIASVDEVVAAAQRELDDAGGAEAFIEVAFRQSGAGRIFAPVRSAVYVSLTTSPTAATASTAYIEYPGGASELTLKASTVDEVRAAQRDAGLTPVDVPGPGAGTGMTLELTFPAEYVEGVTGDGALSLVSLRGPAGNRATVRVALSCGDVVARIEAALSGPPTIELSGSRSAEPNVPGL